MTTDPMTDIAALVADNIDIWTSAIQRKSGAGRGGGGGKRISLYGIERLRALILDLAVRGKLVPQDAGDEPASELLSKIRKARKKRLVIQNRTLSLDGAQRPTRVNVPPGWQITTLQQVFEDIHYGYTASADHGLTEIRLLRITDIQNGLVEWDTVPGCKISEKQASQYMIKDGDIMIARTGGTIGKTYVAKDVSVRAVFASYLIRAQAIDADYSPYLQVYFGSDIYWHQLRANSAGTGQPNVNATALKSLELPLPPLAEQRRIVAKVDELMALCDALERDSAGAMAAHQALVEALLAALVNSADAADLARQWTRLESHFDTLFTTDASIEALKQTILDLAVRGKLVEQDAGDEDALHVLARAVSAQNHRIGLAKRKSKGDFEPSKSKFESFSPDHWVWAYIGDFALVKGGKRIPKGKGFSAQITDHIYIRVTDMERGTVNLDNLVYIDNGVHREIAQYTINSSDIYVTIAGTIGHVGAVPEILDGQHLTENAAKIVFSEIDQRYLLLVLNADDVQDQFANKMQVMAQPKLALKRIAGARVPIPPLAEQRRIVAKVDALMALCDALKARLADAAQTQRHLADAITQRAAA